MLGSFSDGVVGPNVEIPHQQYDLGWARKFGRKTTFGVRFEHAFSKTEQDDEEVAPANRNDNEWNTTAFHGGVKLDFSGADFFELGGEIRTLSYKELDVEDDAGASFRASARYW